MTGRRLEFVVRWLSPVVHDYLRRFHNHSATTFVPTRALKEELGAVGFERLQVRSIGGVFRIPPRPTRGYQGLVEGSAVGQRDVTQ